MLFRDKDIVKLISTLLKTFTLDRRAKRERERESQDMFVILFFLLYYYM